MTPRIPKQVSKLLPDPSERLSVSADDLEDLLREALRVWDLDDAVSADTVVRDVVGGFRRMYARQVEAPGLVQLSDVQPERVDWLWPGRIPMGRLTLLEGDPGLGKSTATMDLAARVTRGAPMPHQGTASLPPMGVVLLTAEDGLADTVRPRLDAAGADPIRVVALRAHREISDTGKEEWRLPSVQHVDELEVAIRRCEAGLVIVDPLMAFLGSGVDGHRDTHVRSALAGLAGLAERTGVAVLAVRHLKKAGSSNALYAGGGSIGFIAAARAAYLLAKDPEDSGRLILAPVKNNLAATPRSLALRIVSGPGLGTRIVWEEETDVPAVRLLKPPGADERSVLEAANEFLLAELADGPLEVTTLKVRAEDVGIGWRTVQRAKSALGIDSRKVGFGADGRWVWSLEDEPRQRSGAVNTAGGPASFANPPSGQEKASDGLPKGRQEDRLGTLTHDDPQGDLQELARCADCGTEVELSPAHALQRCGPCAVRAGRKELEARLHRQNGAPDG